MPQVPTENNCRISIRIPAKEKALLLRAVALRQTNLTEFVVQTAVKAAGEVIAEAEQVNLSERDSLRVLALLEKPPAPNARLRAAARALAKKK
ncbi:MAG: DUF1778 domain-containing protein [Candidatus Hydrogenedentes bacterium]|nr:DUF1778 domain-containing protein [Candidatus Hydrogenedentota bacterium]